MAKQDLIKRLENIVNELQECTKDLYQHKDDMKLVRVYQNSTQATELLTKAILEASEDEEEMLMSLLGVARIMVDTVKIYLNEIGEIKSKESKSEYEVMYL